MTILLISKYPMSYYVIYILFTILLLSHENIEVQDSGCQMPALILSLVLKNFIGTYILKNVLKPIKIIVLKNQNRPFNQLSGQEGRSRCV